MDFTRSLPAAAIASDERARPAGSDRAAHRILPGLLLTGAVGLLAHLVAKLVFPHGLAVGLEVPLAMLLGLIVVNLTRASAGVMPGIRFAVKYVLGLGIVLLGLRLNLQSIAVIGAEALGLVLITIGTSCAFAILIGRRLGVSAARRSAHRDRNLCVRGLSDRRRRARGQG